MGKQIDFRRGFLHEYGTTYSFVDKDPIIDVIRTAIADSEETYTEISKRSNVTTATIYNWLQGPTRKPQFATVMRVLRALGIDLRPVKWRGK